jgi:hypothetical protein
MRKSVKEILEVSFGDFNTRSIEHREWIREATIEELNEYILDQPEKHFREMACVSPLSLEMRHTVF